jgi:CubicO group peptidase (beta-lactamase class C family)
MRRLSASAAVVLLVVMGAAVAIDWASVDNILDDAISRKVMPGCVALVATRDGVVYRKAHGALTYGLKPPQSPSNAPTTETTKYDLASLTKVTATTSAAAQFYQRGELDLDMPVADGYLLGPRYAAQGKETITPRNLLMHNAGYPPDPVPGYSTSSFDCPATGEAHPAEVLSCDDHILNSLYNQTLINPPDHVYVYSDLSMITMHFIVGTLADRLGYVSDADLLPECQSALGGGAGNGTRKTCFYEAYVRTHVLGKLGMSDSGFLPAKSSWGEIAPTWVDDTYRHITLQGQVSDENSYALGGIAGHAGLFSHVDDLHKLTSALVWPSESVDFLNETTIAYWTRAQNLTQSSRALGWDTNNYKMNTYRGCGNLSETTFTHTGYTGTQLCNDPAQGFLTILLTNRCYPEKTAQMGTIHTVRQQFNNEVLALLTQDKENN